MGPRDLVLLPRDGFFFKDGRGWTKTGDAGRTAGLPWPFPPTLRGALRTAYGFDCIAGEGRAWSPAEWLDKTRPIEVSALLPFRRRPGESWSMAHRWWPAPADALALEGQGHLEMLQPTPSPAGHGTLGRDKDEAREKLWWPRVTSRAKPLPAAPWWCDQDFADWLSAKPVAQPPHVRQPLRLEVHLAIASDTQTAEEAALFTTTRYESLDCVREVGRAAWAEWALALRADLPNEWGPRVVPLGADRRPAIVEDVTPRSIFSAPPTLAQAWQGTVGGLRLLCVTPGNFGGWCLPGFAAHDGVYRGRLPALDGDWDLRAALVPRAQHESGWDMAAGRPKDTRRLAPAGAVYFLTKSGGGRVDWQEAKTLWMAALGAGIEEGLGRVVPAIWEPRGRN